MAENERTREDERRHTEAIAQKNEPNSQRQGSGAGQVPGQAATADTGNAAQQADAGEDFKGTAKEEQEGQKANVEQSHQTNTAQYTGKPGVKAPSPGKEQGTAWSQDIELSNSDKPAGKAGS